VDCQYPDPNSLVGRSVSRSIPTGHKLIGTEIGKVTEPETTRLGNSCSQPIVVSQDAFVNFGPREKRVPVCASCTAGARIPCEGKQTRFFVFVPRVSPISGSANLAVKRVKNLAEDLIEVNE